MKTLLVALVLVAGLNAVAYASGPGWNLIGTNDERLSFMLYDFPDMKSCVQLRDFLRAYGMTIAVSTGNGASHIESYRLQCKYWNGDRFTQVAP